MLFRSRYKIKSTIKEGAAILMPLDLLFGGAAAASPKSATKWPAPTTAAAKKNPVAATQTSIAAGEKIYTKHCAACHRKNEGGDGPGIEDLGIPPTRLSDPHLRAESDSAVVWIITSGKKPMPGYERRRSETDPYNLINYFRTPIHE